MAGGWGVGGGGGGGGGVMLYLSGEYRYSIVLITRKLTTHMSTPSLPSPPIPSPLLPSPPLPSPSPPLPSPPLPSPSRLCRSSEPGDDLLPQQSFAVPLHDPRVQERPLPVSVLSHVHRMTLVLRICFSRACE